MRYTVIGAGGMGIQFGVLLQENAGCDVDFIDGWSENIEAIRAQNGAYVSQDGQDRHLVPIDVYYPEEYTGDPDVWIVFVKQHQLAGLLERCAPLFRSHQAVFSAMNGHGHFERLNGYFPADRIYGGTALIGAYVYGPCQGDEPVRIRRPYARKRSGGARHRRGLPCGDPEPHGR